MPHTPTDHQRLLERHFSAPIARAIVVAACRAGRAAARAEQAQRYHDELAHLLGKYLRNADKRQSCELQLAELSPPFVWGQDDAVASTEPTNGNERAPSTAPKRRSTLAAMELGAPSAGTRVLVRHESDVPNACEVARDLGRKLGFSQTDQTHLAAAVAELSRNMLQYAGGGSIRFAEVHSPRPGLEAYFEDQGPGIADLEGVLEPGGLGLGLRGSRDVADEFLIDSQPGDGTRITMRKYVA